MSSTLLMMLLMGVRVVVGAIAVVMFVFEGGLLTPGSLSCCTAMVIVVFRNK